MIKVIQIKDNSGGPIIHPCGILDTRFSTLNAAYWPYLEFRPNSIYYRIWISVFVINDISRSMANGLLFQLHHAVHTNSIIDGPFLTDIVNRDLILIGHHYLCFLLASPLDVNNMNTIKDGYLANICGTGVFFNVPISAEYRRWPNESEVFFRDRIANVNSSSKRPSSLGARECECIKCKSPRLRSGLIEDHRNYSVSGQGWSYERSRCRRGKNKQYR